MKLRGITKVISAGAALAAAVLLGMLIDSPGRASNDNNGAQDEQLMIVQGYAIAPVPLNLANKDHDLVGLGSYIVNAVADCNGCHTPSPFTQYIPAGNPYFLSPPAGPFTGKQLVNPATYLAGGQDFGTVDPGGLSAHIISRNLTPDRTGMPEGGHSYSDFYQIVKTGIDMDKVHPTCTGALNPGCVPPPVNGKVLLVMPWPAFQNMTDRQLQAIYQYLSAIPCISGPPSGELHNDCGH